MGLSSIQLDAFLEVARQASFSRAAEALNITQSALSQRILKFEEELGFTVFIRDVSGIKLTDAGTEVLRYCNARESMEEELLANLRGKNSTQLSGRFSVAGFSSIMRSTCVPSLASIARENPAIRFEFHSRELRDLPAFLERAQADVVLIDRMLDRTDWEFVQLGYEESVLIRPTRATWAKEVYLDHDPDDRTTFEFLKLQRMASAGIRRNYFDEIYSIIDAVAQGFGQGVVPRHLIDTRGVEIVRGLKPLRVPVYAVRKKQGFYTRLQTKAFEALCDGARKMLS